MIEKISKDFLQKITYELKLDDIYDDSKINHKVKILSFGLEYKLSKYFEGYNFINSTICYCGGISFINTLLNSSDNLNEQVALLLDGKCKWGSPIKKTNIIKYYLTGRLYEAEEQLNDQPDLIIVTNESKLMLELVDIEFRDKYKDRTFNIDKDFDKIKENIKIRFIHNCINKQYNVGYTEGYHYGYSSAIISI